MNDAGALSLFMPDVREPTAKRFAARGRTVMPPRTGGEGRDRLQADPGKAESSTVNLQGGGWSHAGNDQR
ncbi:MAG: hypothetical protein AB7T18_06485 [Alphaproteobacteria bacterium]